MKEIEEFIRRLREYANQNPLLPFFISFENLNKTITRWANE